MVGRKRAASVAPSPFDRRTTTGRGAAVPDVFREMLVEARSSGIMPAPSARHQAQRARSSSEPEERPVKRKRPGQRTTRPTAQVPPKEPPPRPSDIRGGFSDDDDDDEGIVFEDVIIPAPTVQTMVLDSSNDDEEDDEDEVDMDFGAASDPAKDRVLDLNLTATRAAMASAPPPAADRRKPISSKERERRVEIHKMHLLCLLSHVQRRNRWCSDPEVHAALRPLVSERMLKYLLPRETLTQYSRTLSLKNGIQDTLDMIQARFAITERGMRRALWAEDMELLKNYRLPDDIDSTLEKSDFIDAAKSLKGSRDVGAQLYCALLRCAGLEARLVCSLQPLSCAPGAPQMPKSRAVGSMPSNPEPSKSAPKLSKGDVYEAAMARYDTRNPPGPASSTALTPRQRLGHPLAAAYRVPAMRDPEPAPQLTPAPTVAKIKGESPFPVFWVEVLDVAHQKWHPIDPLVTRTLWKPQALEPPANDRESCLTYVIAFEADGSARDVTRRYAKAYNSKTRKMRVDGAPAANRPVGSSSAGPGGGGLSGQRWWRRTMRTFERECPTDLDQIEMNELAAEETKEPMPRNVADFKDHPLYALQRHLRRHEVIVPDAKPIGTVGAGSKAPLERIYRRRDVRIAYSREKWYRLGREVKPGAEPVKILPKRRKPKRRKGRFDDSDDDDDDDDDMVPEYDDDPDKVGLFGEAILSATSVPLYTAAQTTLYEAPPVVNGRVPKNKFGNIDLYVPSMVPRGGTHVVHELAAQAAFTLGVDFAPALTGFSFKGREGTAVLSGVVVPEEAEEAVRAAIAGLEDLEAERERERRSRMALRMWSWFLKGLRIRDRIWAGAAEADEADDGDDRGDKGKGIASRHEDDGDEDDDDSDLANLPSDVSEEFSMAEDDDEGGGFFVE